MTEQEIKAEIERIINGRYTIWTIGVTDRPEQRRQEHGSPKYWHHWDATTEQVARRIEQYFIDQGCKGGVGGGVNPNYVYIF